MSEPDWTVRPARVEDAELLVAFNRAMALETEGVELDVPRLRRGVEAVFALPHRGRYYVAEHAGAVRAGLMITFEWSDWRDGVFWWIQSVYVEPEWRRTGAYAALHAYLLDEARATEGVCGLRLYVEHENAGARAVYERVGLRRSGYLLYETDFVIER